MSEYYCHVKTTPNMEIATAVRMSISFPGKGYTNSTELEIVVLRIFFNIFWKGDQNNDFSKLYFAFGDS